MGFSRPAIFGFGTRGKTLLQILDDNDIEVVTKLDKSIPQSKPMEVLLDENSADVIIVSIWDGDKIADDLRTRLSIPVFTLEELLDEQSK